MEPRNLPSAGRRGTSGSRTKYAPRACQECRRRRVKCDGQKPSCARCLSRDKACVFTDEADNRGSAPRSYVALLQARIKVLEEVLWLHSIDVDASIALLETQRTELDSGPSEAAYSSSLAFNEMCADFEGALYLDEPLCDLEQPAGEARFFGTTSGRLELKSSQDVSTTSPDKAPSSSIESQPETTKRDASMDASIIDELVAPDLKDQLINLYFEWDQPWYQLVDERLFRQSLQCDGRYSSPLLLCSILALGSRYSDDIRTRSDADDPNTAGRVLAETADILLQREMKSPNITTLQALGVLGYYHVGVGSDGLGWLYHGMANRLLLDMGLNLDNTAITGMGSLARDEVRLRRQIYWGLYCNDKLWASYTGRVCTMLDSQGAIPLPSVELTEDSFGDTQSQDLPRFQRAMATLCQILEKILTNLYAPRRLASAAEKRIFFDSCILTLKGWYYSLAKELKVKAAGPNDPVPSPHACIVNMVYHTSIVLLAKPFLRHRISTETRMGTPQSPGQDDILRRASAASLEAAEEVCFLGDRYRELFGSFRRSPLTATHCTLTAALVLMFVQPPDTETDRGGNITKLQGCLQTLRELSVSWGPPLRYWRTLTTMLSRQTPQNWKDHGAASGIQLENSATDNTSFGIPHDVPAVAVPRPSEALPDHRNQYLLSSDASEAPTTMGAAGISIGSVHQPWDDTTELFTEEGFLNDRAFDAMAWDDTSKVAHDFQFWGPDNS